MIAAILSNFPQGSIRGKKVNDFGLHRMSFPKVPSYTYKANPRCAEEEENDDLVQFK